jgi:rsbT co-antagonist protein RsbR
MQLLARSGVSDREKGYSAWHWSVTPGGKVVGLADRRRATVPQFQWAIASLTSLSPRGLTSKPCAGKLRRVTIPEIPMAANEATKTLAAVVNEHEKEILLEWMELQKKAGSLRTGRITEAELSTQSSEFLHLLRDGLAQGGMEISSNAYAPLRQLLSNMSRSRALQGFSPTETATFVFSIKQPLFNLLNRDRGLAPAELTSAIWALTILVDELGLITFETFQKSREEVILRQQREITELSTPVVKLWDGILALPIIGTLDSERTQVVMENLLQHVVDDGAEIAIIDITGVPTVDTLTAQHLLKTVAAARLMGADCIISGIRPQIAQTIVHLGVELNVISKATLADAFSIALRRTNRGVTKLRSANGEDTKAKAPASERGD